ncbi:APA family basic amino acid/polyamine antiporter [Silvibacterium bohemicum]|uniref:APA family basic amino acid/polyamine antiporter n=1 Tax=Silvibacterium bohemicum TaxID=1577686 RepID=A0A841K3Z2_9BACT|nr:amino acid permease [Silvibacterium bohemicum]MBB6144974.1 APA family basic amino acid/polyamine antiporter [Silvibacterium bohemicum]
MDIERPQTSPDQSASQTHELPRVLRTSHATAIVVGTLIGSGIFLVPHEMMQATGSSGLVYLAWIVGGLLSLFGAMTYAELSSMLPYTGGEYVYLRGAYGDLTAFLYMWTWFAVAKPASIASVTTGLARTLAIFPAFAWLEAIAFRIPFSITWAQLFAIAATWLITGLNYLGIKKAGDFQLVFTWLKGILILVIAGFCFASASGHWNNFGTSFVGAHGGFGGFMIALIAALWAYDGWNDLTMVSGEVQQPEKSLPIALIAGLGIVGVLYMATNAAIQYILPAAAIAASPRPAVSALSVVTGPWGAALVSGVMALSIFVTLNGTIMSGARVPFAAAKDGLFFKRMADISPRFQSPSTSLVVQALLTTGLLLAVGRFQQLFELAIFAEWLFYMITATTIFHYRRSLPQATTYRVWGYPVVPILFVVAAAVLLYYSYAENLKNSLLGTAVILLGVPLYYALRPRQATAS